MTAVLPGPRAFRGDEPEASMLFNAFAFTNRGIYTPLPYFERGFGGGLDFLLVLVLLVGSFFAARAVTARATRIQEATGERPATLLTNLAIWFGPLIAVSLILGLSFELPALKGFNFTGGITIRGSVDRPLVCLVDLHGGLHCRKRACRHPGGVQRPDRGCRRIGPAPKPHNEPCCAASGAADHHPAADFKLP